MASSSEASSASSQSRSVRLRCNEETVHSLQLVPVQLLEEGTKEGKEVIALMNGRNWLLTEQNSGALTNAAA